MKLYHYSQSFNLTLNNLKLSPETPIKPKGIWLSYDENSWGWKDWCLAEDFRIDHL